jgi:hypothetical protein
MLPQSTDNPFQLKLSFHKIIEGLEQTALIDTGWRGQNAKELLKKVSHHPELIDGITDQSQIDNNAGLISELLEDLFPKALTLNEIKAVTIPYQGIIFNHTQRFKNILADAGPDFEINIRGFDDHQFYVMSCCIILNRFYGTNLDFGRPWFYDIPTATGIIRHYRMMYNADFMEIIPTEEALKLTQSDIDQLINNYDDLALWKEKFPSRSWILKGFIMMTLFDATVENAVSNLKTNLLGSEPKDDLQKNLQSIFRSIFKIADMRMGFTLFDRSEHKFFTPALGPQIHSFLLSGQSAEECSRLLCDTSYHSLIGTQEYFAVSDIDAFLVKHPDSDMARHFSKQNIKSFILAPVVKNGVLLGILELVSPRIREFNSVNAHMLEIIMPFLVDTIDRKISETQNRVRAIIQSNYTTLHPSVYWKFQREAQNYIQSVNRDLAYTLKEITFKEVYPLYGQVDISESSATRNISVRNDLGSQLKQLIAILKKIKEVTPSATIDGKLFELKTFVKELSEGIRADTEQFLQHYVEERIYPLLKQEDLSADIRQSIESYFKQVDALSGEFYINRRNYDKTLALINEKLADILDTRQAEIQEYFPHYYERFKTDGIEHNMYIGASIAPTEGFTIDRLHRLRLWQLRVIAEMEIEQHDLKNILPYPLDVTSLILVFSTPIAIRFRMDEKHFDVDGAYNIRYEVIKKRIDKAHIKNSTERITKQGKITIIYSKEEEAEEYTHYISILQDAGILESHIEHFEVEELQGVAGLKALRVAVIHHQKGLSHRTASYKSLYKHLKQLPVQA